MYHQVSSSLTHRIVYYITTTRKASHERFIVTVDLSMKSQRSCQCFQSKSSVKWHPPEWTLLPRSIFSLQFKTLFSARLKSYELYHFLLFITCFTVNMYNSNDLSLFMISVNYTFVLRNINVCDCYKKNNLSHYLSQFSILMIIPHSFVLRAKEIHYRELTFLDSFSLRIRRSLKFTCLYLTLSQF